jgi:hypothetical protein
MLCGDLLVRLVAVGASCTGAEPAAPSFLTFTQPFAEPSGLHPGLTMMLGCPTKVSFPWAGCP